MLRGLNFGTGHWSNVGENGSCTWMSLFWQFHFHACHRVVTFTCPWLDRTMMASRQQTSSVFSPPWLWAYGLLLQVKFYYRFFTRLPSGVLVHYHPVFCTPTLLHLPHTLRFVPPSAWIISPIFLRCTSFSRNIYHHTARFVCLLNPLRSMSPCSIVVSSQIFLTTSCSLNIWSFIVFHSLSPSRLQPLGPLFSTPIHHVPCRRP